MPTNTPEHVKAAGRSLLKKGIARVIVTLGEKGCLLLTAEESGRKAMGDTGFEPVTSTV